MSEPANTTELKPKKRIRTITPPPRLQAEVARKAKVIRKHAEALGPLGMQAIQIATLQVVATKLEELRRLMESNGVSPQTLPIPTVAGLPPAPPPPPKVLNPCVMCGRPGAYQMRFGARGWYCAGEHANWARQEDGEELRSKTVSPSQTSPPPAPAPVAPPTATMNAGPPTPATPGLANALRMLTGGEDT